LRSARYDVRMWPAEWRVEAYGAPGLPIEQISRG